MTLCCLLVAVLFTAQTMAGTLARFDIPGLGEIVVELFDQEKPVTVGNFVRLVEAGAYQNMFLHRCMPGFVVQGGGMRVSDPSCTNQFNSYFDVPNFGPITNEFDVGARFSNVFGTIAMAKVADNPDSATSQWFFNLNDNSANLDSQNGGFTVFGRVIRGTNVLENFNSRIRGSGIVDLTWWLGPSAGLFSDLPVFLQGIDYPRFSDLTYCRVSLVKPEMQLQPDSGTIISWQSVSGLVNKVDCSTDPRDSWHTIFSANGDGETMSFLDSNTVDSVRLYRLSFDP